MNCQQVQSSLSLYLYGELDFAREDALEEHLTKCAFCQRALEREKSWHTSLNAEHADVPLDFLAACRRDLRDGVGRVQADASRISTFERWFGSIRFFPSVWSTRLAIASALVIVGFGLGRWANANGIFSIDMSSAQNRAGILTPYSRVREIQPADSGRVRIVVDQIRQREIIGAPDDEAVRHVLIAAAQDPVDPAIRVDSVVILSGQPGTDVRDALSFSVRHDPNPAVRLKALDGLRQFANDGLVRQTLKHVLEQDDNAGVRSEAIDVLAPRNEHINFSPDLVSTLQEIMRHETSDEYVRQRCWQVLQQMNASPDVY